MDPEASLRLASEALQDGELVLAAQALVDYNDWRACGGFEPEGGDELFQLLTWKVIHALAQR